MGVRKIIFHNRKGGVGKTASAVNIAAALVGIGEKVLLIDLDSQAHATLSLGIKAENGLSIINFLQDSSMSPILARDVKRGLFIIPSSFDLSKFEMKMGKEPRMLLILKKRLLEIEEEYDFIIMDTPPNFGFLTLSAYLASNEIIVPMPPHFLALKALAETKTICEKVSQKNKGLIISGVLLTFYNQNLRHSRSVIAEISRAFGKDVLLPPIRNSVRLAEAPSFGKTIFEYAPDSKVAQDYLKAAKAILNMTVSRDQMGGHNE